jgi:L-ascorbate metabolism protein UlaG (beta-lactamase superfamily)
MRLLLVRHATLLVEMAGLRLLVDPMLGPAQSQPPMPDTTNNLRNPLVELPMPGESLVKGISAAIITHLHPDHIDQAALALLPRDRPVLCQPRDRAPIAGQGLAATAVEGTMEAGPLRISRTGGQHGTGAIGREMGEVSGFVIAADGEPTLYIAGDTVWCEEVREALDTYSPDVVVVNAGGARFLAGDVITMDVPDVVAVCEHAPDALVVAVHMEAINHCMLTRDALRAALAERGLEGRVAIPKDGETLELTQD